MARNAPGKHFRKGMTLLEVLRSFSTESAAEEWFIETRWSDGMACPRCGSENVYAVKNRKPQPFRCRDCKKYFSAKTGTVMEGSNLNPQTWAIAFYLLATGLKGTSSMKLHRVRLFFVDGPRGFCQRHGKSYLTRRRRGGEGGGGGLLTGRAIPSAYRWAWCPAGTPVSWKSQYASRSRLAS